MAVSMAVNQIQQQHHALPLRVSPPAPVANTSKDERRCLMRPKRAIDRKTIPGLLPVCRRPSNCQRFCVETRGEDATQTRERHYEGTTQLAIVLLSICPQCVSQSVQGLRRIVWPREGGLTYRKQMDERTRIG